MIGRTRKLGALVVVAAAAALSFSAVGPHVVSASPLAADSDDNYNPANTTITGTTSNVLFTVGNGAIAVTCTNSVATGKTPATGLKPFKIVPPTFNDGAGQPCTDNLGGTDTTTTSGTWKLGAKDKSNDETGTEPNSGDSLFVMVPKGGAVVHNSFGCTITVAPSAAFKVTGAYDDVSQFTVNISNLPVVVTGGIACPTNATTATFNAVYTFNPHVSDGS